MRELYIQYKHVVFLPWSMGRSVRGIVVGGGGGVGATINNNDKKNQIFSFEENTFCILL